MKTILLALACAFGLGGGAGAAQPLRTASFEAARADAMNRLAAGDVQLVANERVQRKRAVRSNPYSLRALHRRGAWCSKGRWYGKRCNYTPSGLKPFRQR